MVRVHAYLLTRGELQHMLVLVLIVRGRTAHVTSIVRAQDHGLAMMNTIV